MIDVAIYKLSLSHLSQIVDSMDPQMVKKELFPILNDYGLENGYRNGLQLDMFGFNRWQESAQWGFLYQPFVALDIADFYKNEYQIISALKKTYSQQESFSKKDLKTIEKKQWMIGSMDWPSQLFSMNPKVLESMAWCRLTRAAVEARIYQEKAGRWPQNVGELPKNNSDDYTDPFADKGDLQIQPVGKGIRISSLGPEEGVTQENPKGGRRSLDWVIK
jgi:hypothetical protein